MMTMMWTGLPPILFKRLKHCLSYPLALLYNQLISVHGPRTQWMTHSSHVPVHKKGATL